MGNGSNASLDGTPTDGWGSERGEDRMHPSMGLQQMGEEVSEERIEYIPRWDSNKWVRK